jgi:hypothetical protein
MQLLFSTKQWAAMSLLQPLRIVWSISRCLCLLQAPLLPGLFVWSIIAVVHLSAAVLLSAAAADRLQQPDTQLCV